MKLGTVYSLSAKDLRVLTKKGFTIADMCEKYNCDEDALREQIRRILYNNHVAINKAWNEFLANAKKRNGISYTAQRILDCSTGETKMVVAQALSQAEPKPQGTPGATSQGTPEATSKVEPEAMPNVEPEAMPNVEPEATPKAEPEEMTKEPDRESLQRDLEILERIKCDLGRQYADLDRKYAYICSQLSCFNAKIKAIEDELERVKKARDDLITEGDKAREERDKIGERRKLNAKAIDEAAKQLAELDKVQLYACNDGNIEALDSPNFVMDDSGKGDIFTSLTESDECGSLTINDLRLLARVIAIYQNSQHKISVTFDSDILSEHFAKFLAGLPRLAG